MAQVSRILAGVSICAVLFQSKRYARLRHASARAASSSNARWLPPRPIRKTAKMMAVYDDNFGFWEIDEPEERAFFEYVQRQSVRENL